MAYLKVPAWSALIYSRCSPARPAKRVERGVKWMRENAASTQKEKTPTFPAKHPNKSNEEPLTTTPTKFTQGVGITAAAGTKSCHPFVFGALFTGASSASTRTQSPRRAHASSLPPRIESGKGPSLLPSVLIAAVSQAASPTSHADASLPIVGSFGHDPNDSLMGQMLD